jgi:hypothetical protein
LRRLGLIAEDQSDVDVISALARKISTKEFAIRKRLGYGCGRIHAKANAWSRELSKDGCTLLMVVCDADDNDVRALHARLSAALLPCPIPQSVVVIPVREIEAWLIADNAAVTKALKLQKVLKHQPNPEALVNPKERLREIVHERSEGRTRYLNTIHNVKIAKYATISRLRRCKSFGVFEDFLTSNLR